MAAMTSALSMARAPSPMVEKLRAAVEHALEGKPEAVELALITLVPDLVLFLPRLFGYKG